MAQLRASSNALFSSNLSVAQVIGDTTLPVGERSLVTGNPNFQIDGGFDVATIFKE
jgi:hypothetical protein